MATGTHTYGREPSTRRQFFGTAAMLLAGAALSAGLHAATGHAPELRPVYRQTAAGWERVRMYELKVGDVMKVVFDLPPEVFVGRVTEAPKKTGRHWGCVAESLPAEAD